MQKLKEKKLILMVDDDEFYHDAAEIILKDSYDIVYAKSGKEAVEYLLNRKKRVPNLILMDIVMPEMDGWLTYNRIRGIDTAANIPVAIVSSLQGASVENFARYVGVADVITKPYNKKDLLERINKILE